MACSSRRSSGVIVLIQYALYLSSLSDRQRKRAFGAQPPASASFSAHLQSDVASGDDSLESIEGKGQPISTPSPGAHDVFADHMM
jgi:hypothetical protein